ncbi:MAG: type II CAAX endopeptidase family protein, partial [Bacteroidota bacterium]
KETVLAFDKFCGHCGKKITQPKEEREKGSLQLVIIFYLTFLVYSIVSFVLFSESDSLGVEIALEAVFIMLTLLFTFFDVKRIYALYNFRLVNWKNVLFSLVFPVFTAFVVYYAVEWLNLGLFEQTDNVFVEYAPYANTVFWVLIFYTVIPPIFEELAFRGFLFNQLSEIASPQVTILATAFIFALVHFSLVSILWIFPFGIMLGYLRYKYKTLWLGMIIHFIHNFLVIALDYYYYHQDEFQFLEF